MPVNILNIETSEKICSVAMSTDGVIVSHRSSDEERMHGSVLTVFIEEIMRESGIDISHLHAVAVGKGPGSYTGLRIGVSVAKGICYAASIPLIAVDTLTIMTKGFLKAEAIDSKDLLCAMLDARRLEVYCAYFDTLLNLQGEIKAEIWHADSAKELLDFGKVHFFGSGAEKLEGMLIHSNSKVYKGYYSNAIDLGLLSFQSYQQSCFENVAYFEPFYLKDFVITTKKKDLLNSVNYGK